MQGKWLLNTTESCTYGVAVVVTAYTRSAQARDRPNHNTEREVGMMFTPATELLTGVRCCTERKDRFSLRCVAPNKSTLFQGKVIHPRIFGEKYMYTQSWVGREGGKGLYLRRYRRGKVNFIKVQPTEFSKINNKKINKL